MSVFILLLPLFIILLSLSATIAAKKAPENESPTCSRDNKDTASCSLILAPSSIPGAGFGIYTLKDIHKGETVGGLVDAVIPIQDSYKTLPYRGQQQFLSWLGYVWPMEIDHFYPAETNSFPLIPDGMYPVDPGLNAATGVEFYSSDNEERISAFSPGIASLANSNPREVNIEQKDGDAHNEVSFVATRDISAGSELYLNYGREWHKRHYKKQTSTTQYETLEDYQDRLETMTLPTEHDKRASLHKQPKRRLEMDDDDEYDNDEYDDDDYDADDEYDETNTDDECFDVNPKCFAFRGECETNPGYMHRFCLKTCGLCAETVEKNDGNADDDDEECFDTDPECEAFAHDGECEQNAGYMGAFCRASCGLCDGEDEDEVMENEAIDTKRGGFLEKVKGFIADKLTGSHTQREEEDNDCVDEDESCPQWASMGDCDYNPAYMHVYCRESCNMCDGGDEDNERLSKQRVAWLKEHGVYLDALQAGISDKINERGAFAKAPIAKGELIAPAPLLVIKREDLRIYEANETQPAYRNVLNLDNVTGEELLLNYCYGDPDSELLLVPYSPIVNYINHDGVEPNAEIRWAPDQPNEWLEMHPLDVLDMSGKLIMGFVALRDIQPGEEIYIDYGSAWEKAWNEHQENNRDPSEFRHEIGVPKGFFPDAWKNQLAFYELALLDAPLKPGELSQLTWKHNDKPVCKNCYRVGLPSGFSNHIRKFSDERGITELYEKLLSNNILESDKWTVFNTCTQEEWFAQKYKSRAWAFNMHYIAAWDEAARVSFLRAFGSGGFDTVLDGIGTEFGLDNMTCFHLSFMGVSEADDSFTHTDVYASDEKGFNIIFPMIVVDGSSPELDIISDDTNVVLSVNYEYDVAFVLGDNGYHKTSPNSYEEKGQMRIVVGAYCAQIDESNAKMMHYIYDGEDPAPFCGQFYGSPEIHWAKDGIHSLPK